MDTLSRESIRLSVWERYEYEWSEAVEDDDQEHIKSLWISMNWYAFHDRYRIPYELLPWVFARENGIVKGRTGDQDDDESDVFVPMVTSWVKSIAEWTRDQASTRFKR